MYDPKFEKGVRQKMEGLEFTPSDSVWPNIQKAVADQRRRRGGFYFWRVAIPAALLAGLVSVGYFAARPGKTSPARPNAAFSTAATAASPAAKPDGKTAERSDARPDGGLAARSDAKPDGKGDAKSNAMGSSAVHSAPLPAVYPANTRHKPAADNHNAVASRNAEADGDAISPSGATATVTAAGSGAARTVTPASSGAASRTIDPAGSGATAIAPYLYQPALAGQRSAAAIKAATPSAGKGLVALGRLEKTKRPWEAGFTAGGGISRLNRLNISAASQDQTLSANLYNFATAAATPSKKYVSDVRPDASFTAGIYLQKPLSRRWSVNLGMNLHYYSSRITIGQQVNTYVPAAASLIAPTVATSAQSSTAFIAGDRQVFTNHYYFLELPVNVQFQLNKSHLLPLFLEGGFSLSRLMGSDALFYNAHSGVYYKDPAVLEKTQFNVASALMVGLPFHGIRIQAGPQVQYGLTPLVNNQNQGDQHFLYAGLRVVVIPGRK